MFIQLVIILAITLFLGELSFRLYNHYRPTFIFYTDSYNRFRGKPFADDWNFKLNSYRTLSNRLNSLKIQNIDLYDYFVGIRGEQLYRPRDTHWNIAGNQLAANIIQEYIRGYVRRA